MRLIGLAMKRGVGTWKLRRGAVLGACLVLTGSLALASDTDAKHASPTNAATVSALLLSDLHFDPFFDPGKVGQLASAPVSGWKSILAGAPSADREARWAALEKTCPARGEDTSFPLLASSMAAIHRHAADAKFVAVSGDLLAHGFDCKFKAVMPTAAGEYRSFAEKTIEFLRTELAAALPGLPLYLGLGNNDSDCGDYQLDAKGEFLSAVGAPITGTFPEEERKAAQETFAAGGYYSVRLPAPIRNTRLLMLDDIFMSNKYATCGGKPDAAPAEAQLAWLQQQLTAARTSGEKVWVVGHIPPGVDIYSTVKKMDQVCGGTGPKMFLGSQKLADVLVEFGDVVDVAIFAHTHMDEVRVLRSEAAGPGGTADKAVAVKMVSSISPINGNAPSFTIAQVETASGALKDFRVFKDAGANGAKFDHWQEEYDWDKTYHAAEFSPATVSKEIGEFEADAGAAKKASREYLGDFFVGKPMAMMELVWPQYVCSLQHYSAEGFKACVCPAAK